MIEIVVGCVDYRQLHVPLILGIILGVAAFEPHVAFNRKQVGKQTAGEHDNQTSMGEMDTELAPRPTKASRMRGDQIDQQHCANEVAARKNRNL